MAAAEAGKAPPPAQQDEPRTTLKVIVSLSSKILDLKEAVADVAGCDAFLKWHRGVRRNIGEDDQSEWMMRTLAKCAGKTLADFNESDVYYHMFNLVYRVQKPGNEPVCWHLAMQCQNGIVQFIDWLKGPETFLVYDEIAETRSDGTASRIHALYKGTPVPGTTPQVIKCTYGYWKCSMLQDNFTVVPFEYVPFEDSVFFQDQV